MRTLTVVLWLVTLTAHACPEQPGRMAGGLIPLPVMLSGVCTPEVREEARRLKLPPSRVTFVEHYLLQGSWQRFRQGVIGSLQSKGYRLVEDHSDRYGLGLVFENKPTTLLVTSTLENGKQQVRVLGGPLDRTLNR